MCPLLFDRRAPGKKEEVNGKMERPSQSPNLKCVIKQYLRTQTFPSRAHSGFERQNGIEKTKGGCGKCGHHVVHFLELNSTTPGPRGGPGIRKFRIPAKNPGGGVDANAPCKTIPKRFLWCLLRNVGKEGGQPVTIVGETPRS